MNSTDNDPSTNGSGAGRPKDEAADIFSNLESLKTFSRGRRAYVRQCMEISMKHRSISLLIDI